MAKFYKFKKLTPSILGVEFKKCPAMALMFMRMQEYSEGVKTLRHNILSEGDSLIAYMKKTKKIYYKAGWAGFNIRGDVFLKVIKEYKGSWNEFETTLIKKVQNKWGMKFDKFYAGEFFIIAWTKGDKPTKKHELVHAEYYLNRAYRNQVNAILENANTKKTRKYLEKLGYNFKDKIFGQYILLDEINAYAMTDKPKDVKKLHLSKSVLKQLRKVYKEFL